MGHSEDISARNTRLMAWEMVWWIVSSNIMMSRKIQWHGRLPIVAGLWGGGIAISVLGFYSDDPSLNPLEVKVHFFLLKKEVCYKDRVRANSSKAPFSQRNLKQIILNQKTLSLFCASECSNGSIKNSHKTLWKNVSLFEIFFSACSVTS